MSGEVGGLGGLGCWGGWGFGGLGWLGAVKILPSYFSSSTDASDMAIVIKYIENEISFSTFYEFHSLNLIRN